jgi:hypothetical protein
MIGTLMARLPAGAVFLTIGALLSGCKQEWVPSSGKVYEPTGDSYPGSVVFDVAGLNNSANPSDGGQWLATYEAQGKVAKFRIELDRPLPSRSAGVDFGSGKLIREPGSDPSVLLSRLKKVLEAKTLPKTIKKSDSLAFEFAIIGRHLSHAKDGGLNAEPPGEWTAIKVFLSGDEGEVFLNLAPALGKGEFSIKDSDYGDFVVAQLATVL